MRSGLPTALLSLALLAGSATAASAGRFDRATFARLGDGEHRSLIIAFDPPGEEAGDAGHGDVVMMDPADTLVWQPIYEWITR